MSRTLLSFWHKAWKGNILFEKTLQKHAYIIVDPLKPHFYIVKLGFTGVYIIFLISAQKQIVGTRYNRLVEAVLTSTHNLGFEQKYEKYQNFYLKTFSFGWWNFQYIWIGMFS